MAHLLILGAGPGIGTSIAIQAARSGAAVSLLARSVDTLDATARAIFDAVADPQVFQLRVDASDPVAVHEVIGAYAREGDEPIDRALFNVSAWIPGGWDADLGAAEAGLRSGVVSGWAMAQALIPTMRDLPAATLLFTGGGTADHPMPASVALGVQKAALRNLAMGLDADLAGTSIRARTLTIRGTIERGGPFDPDAIAAALLALADDRDGPCVVDFTGD
jgi:NAD(P)-dependent dehydrogenase (short-subunit alcohol dehydrogenase family)